MTVGEEGRSIADATLKPVANPIEPATRAIFHRSYHVELEEEYGGWFSEGEVLLRSDGVLFKRSYSLGARRRPDAYWRRDPSWTGGADAPKLWRELERRGYLLDGGVFPVVTDAGDEGR